jgi:multidrug efflux pump subunit AcrA (membrane-fusion protein)
LFERFENTPWSDSHRRRIEFVCRHGATALRHANELAGLPLIGASRFLQRCLTPFALRHLPKSVAILSLIAAAIAALILVPADFEIRGEGQLVPTRYRHLFAPADGVIEKLHVHHAESVTAGTPLLDMRRTDLEYEEARLLGDILTNQKRLDAVRSALLNHKSTSASSAGEFHELTSEEARLQILLASLRNQQGILKRERVELAITSPIDGEVLTWGIEDALALRPVRRGERLLSVADPRGPWQLDLRIADHDIEHILAARNERKELGVSFILTSHTGERYLGTVEEIAMATELDEHDQPSVLVRVAIDREQLPALRPGASVIANVHCGHRPIGYVWLRELFDVIKTRLLF